MSLSTLCVACGLCCDGTLFTHVALAPGEDAALRAEGVEPRMREDGSVLPQRCAALCGRSCTVYGARPQGCRRYQCQLYGALSEGEVSLPEALAAVEEVQGALAALETSLPADGSGLPAVQRARRAVAREEPLGEEARAAWARAEALLDRHLRGRAGR